MVIGRRRKQGKKIPVTGEEEAVSETSELEEDQEAAEIDADDVPLPEFGDEDEQSVDEEGDSSEEPTSDKIEESPKKELNYQEEYLRALAELENFRKRATKERSELLKYQGEKILYDVVEVLDNIELALQHKEGEAEQLRTGVEMIHKMFVDTLSKWGVVPEEGVGKPFDPNKQNAISRIPVDDADPGTVVSELKKTYLYKDKLLREGMVVVAEAPPAQEPSEEGEDEAQDAENTEDSE